MLYQLLNGLHVFLCVAIVGLVLLQRGKGADAGAGFGSGASGTVFGARGSATFLSKSTAVLATLFFVTSLSLAYLASKPSEGPKSVVEQVPDQPATPPAAAPAAPASQGDLPAFPATDTPVEPVAPLDSAQPPAGATPGPAEK
jgi:preprotein translocase subunit SecG